MKSKLDNLLDLFCLNLFFQAAWLPTPDTVVGGNNTQFLLI